MTCSYGDWTFVSDGPQRSDTDRDASQVDVGDDPHATTAASPSLTIPQLPSDSISYHQTGGADPSNNHVREYSAPQSIVSPGEAVITARESVTDSATTIAWTSNDLADDMNYVEVTPRQAIDERSWQQRSMKRQSALLRFRYRLIQQQVNVRASNHDSSARQQDYFRLHLYLRTNER